MTNPYQSPKSTARPIAASPTWYVWFYKAYWPCWWVGTGLVVCSWFSIVTPTVGWIGFALAGAAALGSYILPSLAGITPQDYVMLDSRIVKNRGDIYDDAIERFKNGATLVYDGVAFGIRPNNVIACGVSAGTSTLAETSAMELVEHARSVYEQLRSECPEFASAIDDHNLRISIVSGAGVHARELCRIVDGKLEWQR